MNECDYCGNKGSLQQCGRCLAVKYCSVPCQVDDWPQHKEKCIGGKRPWEGDDDDEEEVSEHDEDEIQKMISYLIDELEEDLSLTTLTQELVRIVAEQENVPVSAIIDGILEFRHDQGFNKTPLTYFIQENNYLAVEELLDFGANVQKKDGDGYTPFTQALKIRSSDIAALLMKRHEKGGGDTLLHKFARHRNGTMIQAAENLGLFVVEKNRVLVNVNARNAWGETALLLAVQPFKSSIPIVSKFLSFERIDVNASSKKGETPLGNAIIFDSEPIVRLLLKKGADVKNTKVLGMTPKEAAEKVGHLNIAALL